MYYNAKSEAQAGTGTSTSLGDGCCNECAYEKTYLADRLRLPLEMVAVTSVFMKRFV